MYPKDLVMLRAIDLSRDWPPLPTQRHTGRGREGRRGRGKGDCRPRMPRNGMEQRPRLVSG